MEADEGALVVGILASVVICLLILLRIYRTLSEE